MASTTPIQPATGQATRPANLKRKLPTPSDEVVQEYIRDGLERGLKTDKKIAEHVLDMVGREKFSVSVHTVRRVRQRAGGDLASTRQQKHTVPTIAHHVNDILQRPGQSNMSARDITTCLRKEKGIRVSEPVVLKYLNTKRSRRGRNKGHDPDDVWLNFDDYENIALNWMWFIDKDDRWAEFGIYLHTAIEPVSGRVMWAKYWCAPSNPSKIASFFLDAAREHKCIPVETDSPSGAEYNGIANIENHIRRYLDPGLPKVLCHEFWTPEKIRGRKTKVFWFAYRKEFEHEYGRILEEGSVLGCYKEPGDLLQPLFQWLVIPWLQAELDTWILKYNTRERTGDGCDAWVQGKLLEPASPDRIFRFAKPLRYERSCLPSRYEIPVSSDLFDRAEQQWVGDHPSNNLVSSAIQGIFAAAFSKLGKPEITRRNLWDVYEKMLDLVAADMVRMPLQKTQMDATVKIELLEGFEAYPDPDDCWEEWLEFMQTARTYKVWPQRTTIRREAPDRDLHGFVL